MSNLDYRISKIPICDLGLISQEDLYASISRHVRVTNLASMYQVMKDLGIDVKEFYSLDEVCRFYKAIYPKQKVTGYSNE